MKSLLHLLLCAVLVALAGCGKKTDERSFTVAVIPKGTTHEFWKSINAGAVKAQQELNGQGCKLDIIWKGPLREDDKKGQIVLQVAF